jgi:inosine-uridine nucleoside N-ribohydrolase
VARYPHRITSNDQVADAVTVYRQLLAKQPDHSVTIVTVGFLTNLANLLNTGPDRYSPLTGRELVTRKVARLVSMAGRFPQGREFNVHKDTKASQVVFDTWPTDVWLSGFEIGQQIKTGLPLVQNARIHSPTKDVFALCLPKAKEDSNGRMSWDQTAVLVAIKGTATFYDLKPGRMIVAADGSNRWDEQGKGHYHLVAKMPVSQVTAVIDGLMQHVPKK